VVEPPAHPLPEGVKRPGLGPRKKKNYMDQIRQWATLCGAELSPKARDSRPSSKLLMQAALVAKDAGRLAGFHHAAYRARWAEARDIAAPEVVRSLLEGAGLEGETALREAESQAIADRLARESQEAADRGVFGAPTLFVGDEMFWGNDQFELVRYYIQKAAQPAG
jgi:2-hydroxychromene-2-carboxylate isomerase